MPSIIPTLSTTLDFRNHGTQPSDRLDVGLISKGILILAASCPCVECQAVQGGQSMSNGSEAMLDSQEYEDQGTNGITVQTPTALCKYLPAAHPKFHTLPHQTTTFVWH